MSTRFSSRVRVILLVFLIGGGAAGRARGGAPGEHPYPEAGAALREAVAAASQLRDPEPPTEAKRAHHHGGFLRSLVRGVVAAAFLPLNIWALQSGQGPFLELPDSHKDRPNGPAPVRRGERQRPPRSTDDLFDARSQEEAFDILEGEVGDLSRHDLAAAVAAAQGARADSQRVKLLRAAYRGSLRRAAVELAAGERDAALTRYAAAIDRASRTDRSMAAVVTRACWAACLRLRETDAARARNLAERATALLARTPIDDYENAVAAHALRLAWLAREHPGDVSASVAGVPAYLRDDACALAALCVGADLPDVADQLLKGAEGAPTRELGRRLAVEEAQFGREHPATRLPVPEDVDLTGLQAVPSIIAYLQDVMAASPEAGSAMLSRANREALLQSTMMVLSHPGFPPNERVQAASELFGLLAALAGHGVDVRTSAGPPELRLLTLGACLSSSHDSSVVNARIDEMKLTLGQLLNARSLPPVPDLTVALAFAGVGRAAPERVPELILAVQGESAREAALRMAANAAADTQGPDAGYRITALIASPTARFAARRRIAMSLVERNDPDAAAQFARSCAATVCSDRNPAGVAGAEATEATRDFCRIVGKTALSNGVPGVHRLLDQLGDDKSGPVRRLHVLGLCFAAPIIGETDRQAGQQLLNEANLMAPRSNVADDELTAARAVASGCLDPSTGIAMTGTIPDVGSRTLAHIVLGGRLLSKDRPAGAQLLERAKHDLGGIKDARRRAEVALVLSQAWRAPNSAQSWPTVDPGFWRVPLSKG